MDPKHRSQLSRQVVVVETKDNDNQEWTYYDNEQLLYLRTQQGKAVKKPVLVCLPPTAGNAILYSDMLYGLAERGYRAISVNYFPFVDFKQLARGFIGFLDEIGLKHVSFFGTELGCYLGLIIAQLYPKRILSLVACNPVADPEYFIKKYGKASVSLETQSAGAMRKELKKYCCNWPTKKTKETLNEKLSLIKQASEVVAAERNTLTRRECISRLTLIRKRFPLNFQSETLMEFPVTIVSVGDSCVSFPEQVSNMSMKLLWSAQVADIKWGGDYPYLTNLEEFLLVVQVHLTSCESNTPILSTAVVNSSSGSSSTPSFSHSAADSAYMSLSSPSYGEPPSPPQSPSQQPPFYPPLDHSSPPTPPPTSSGEENSSNVIYS